ncbi:ras-related protein rab-5c [Anaeramoeba flamelloides]|uniref:Ras-related protein rab-5c n=1 Tax=Anaeramoeba flamelloides TaxID=1746091 RepID=A0AAV8A1N5_9EUKA|nr:ras-related protein rab-5c [Anaeramoeba flamelloides]KAJ6234407.1 ras-related protein rab-5c [Anaeramoeba flamelloides]
MSIPTVQKKIVLLGQSSVGKSSLVYQFCKGEFFENQEPTIGASFLTKELDFSTHKVSLQIWDTAGQERYESLAPMYYRKAAAALVVFDLNEAYTLNKAKDKIQELSTNGEPNMIITLVGNKCDLERRINSEEVKEYCEENGIMYFETSAKTGKGVEEVFQKISRKFKLPKKKDFKNEKRIEGEGILKLEKEKKKEKKKCC